MKALIVEDDSITRDILVEVLSGHGLTAEPPTAWKALWRLRKPSPGMNPMT